LAKALESALKRAAASVSFFNVLRSREGEPFLWWLLLVINLPIALSRWFEQERSLRFGVWRLRFVALA
jgi:hypothetical protein